MSKFFAGDSDAEAALERVRARLLEVIVESDLESMDAPHIVVCRAVGTSIVSYSGPFACGLDAMRQAEYEAAQLTPGDRVEFSVAALSDPLPDLPSPRGTMGSGNNGRRADAPPPPLK